LPLSSLSLTLPHSPSLSLSLSLTAKIPERRPANIPLHTLSSSSRHLRNPSSDSSSSFEQKPLHHAGLSGHRRSSDSAHSDLSLWSDTGDLVDQLDNDDDPLRVALNPSSSSPSLRKPKSNKQVRYQSGTKEGSINKNDISIPNPPPRRISQAERIVAFLMAPTDGPSRMHGLHGKKLIYFTSVFVSLGVFMFGYDQGVMSGIITGQYFKDYFNQPTRAEIGTMVAILEVGAFISSLGVGRIGDILGRRLTILYGACVFVIGGAFQAFATGMPMMMLGRIIAGLGVGALSTIVPVYQSEISPPHNRGKLACIEFSGNVLGYAASVWIDYFSSFIPSHWSWRLPLLMQCVMGALLILGSFLICESPRYVFEMMRVQQHLTSAKDGCWTTTTTKRALSSLPTSTARATFTTPRRVTSTVKSR
jgi:hypothetical protein